MKRKTFIGMATSALLVASVAGSAVAGVGDVDNQADVNHPDIHQNVTGGNNANPNGADGGGGNLHGIANNPGKSGANPNDDGTRGFANQLQTGSWWHRGREQERRLSGSPWRALATTPTRRARAHRTPDRVRARPGSPARSAKGPGRRDSTRAPPVPRGRRCGTPWRRPRVCTDGSLDLKLGGEGDGERLAVGRRPLIGPDRELTYLIRPGPHQSCERARRPDDVARVPEGGGGLADAGVVSVQQHGTGLA